MHLYDSVENHIETNFFLKLNKYSLEEIDNLEPWLREIYISMTVKYNKERKQELDTLDT